MIDLTREEALHILGRINGDVTPNGISIREKLLKFLTGTAQ